MVAVTARRIAVLLVLLVLPAPALLGTTPPPIVGIDDGGPWVVRAYDGSEAMLGRLAVDADHIGIFPGKDHALVHVDDRAMLDRMIDAGFRIEVDQRRTAEHRRVTSALQAGGLFRTIPGFDCYRTVEEMLATGAAIAAEHPTLATWTDIGDSWEKVNAPPAGYDLMVLVLTNQAIGGDKPKLLVAGSTHPRELTTAELVTRFAEHLANGYGEDPDITWLLDYHEVHLILVLNPDGRKRAETGLSWRKNANNNHCTGSNSRGIDLNRNLSFQWAGCNGSSGNECSLTYRGPSAASEPEAQTLQSYMLAIFPDQREPALTAPAPDDATGIFLDIHSFGQVVLSTWGCQIVNPTHPNGDATLRLGRKYGYFPSYRAQLGSTGTVDGTTKDFSYGELGVPGYTVELGTSFFQSCSFFESSIAPGNLEGLVHIAKNARTPYLTPAGPDTVDPAGPSVPVALGGTALVTARIDDTRYDTSPPLEPSQPIASATAWVGTPPWLATDGGGVAMQASDGTFDETVEDVEVSIDTTGLPEGRHTVYIEGRDTDGSTGAVSATFLYVIDPGTSPTVQGTVTDATDGTPLDATVSLGPLTTTTSPGTGVYSLQVPSGTYPVQVTAPGYVPLDVGNRQLLTGQTLVIDPRLQPFETIFEDDVEAGNAGWTAQAPWAMTTETANSPTHSWTDSPGGNHGNNVNSSLTSPVFDLSSKQAATLTFWHRYDLEEGFDFGQVEVSTDGINWQTVAGFSGEGQTTWRRESIPVPGLDGAAQAQVRFRLESDTNVTRDGWHVDDVLLEAADPPSIFADGFETGDILRWTFAVP